jgi:DNA-directed RNA polymerase specialized sigma subunit
MDLQKRLDELSEIAKQITKLQEEKERAFSSATSTTAKPMDGMSSYTGGVSRKVEVGGVKLAMIDDDLDKLLAEYDYKQALLIERMEMLPPKEFCVCYKYFVRGKTLEKIAEEMDYSTMQVWRIKKKAIELLQSEN